MSPEPRRTDEIDEAARMAAFLMAKAVEALFTTLPAETDPETIIEASSTALVGQAERQPTVRFLSDALIAREALREMGLKLGEMRN